MKGWFRSLQAKYMLIIFMALFLVQMSTLLISIVMSIGIDLYGEEDRSGADGIPSASVIEARWHEAAGSLAEVSAHSVQELFAEWKRMYPASRMFWVDGEGRLAEQLDVVEELPTIWTATNTAQFIKSRYGGDPFTVIAFAGGQGTDGFIVFEVTRKLFDPPINKVYNIYGIWLIIGLIVVVVLFVIISYLFFRGMRRRLVQLQEAMTIRDEDGLPVQIDVRKQDEIGQLEQSFNEMVVELKDSKRREQEEEQLRRELIANLSHDLRTPLTKIRAQAYTIGKESLSGDGRQAIEAMERSVVNMDRLIDNLMAYTLLMANKYKFDARQVDILRFAREHLATWYPLFEKEGFEVEVELEKLSYPNWMIDPLWMGRVLDNLYQNVLRHAKQGRYIRVATESTDVYDALVIEDRGSGMRYVEPSTVHGTVSNTEQTEAMEIGDQRDERFDASVASNVASESQGSWSKSEESSEGETKSMGGSERASLRERELPSSRSDDQGVGIGLSIVDRMLKGMQLKWDIHTGSSGTTVKVKRMRG